MAKIFQDEPVHIICVRSHTFVVFSFSHKQPEQQGQK
jgi:hypothetical protein